MSHLNVDAEQLEEARRLVIREGRCSPSWLQRELGTSFTVASALVSQLEEDGVVSGPAGNGQRKVLMQSGESAPEADQQEGDATKAADLTDQPVRWDAEGEHITAIDRLERVADELRITDSNRLVEDVRDFLLDTIKARPKPWSATSQAEKRDVAAACEHVSAELVRKMIEAIAARGVQPVRVLLTKVAMGNEIVVTGKVKAFDPHEEHRAISILYGALNKHVMLTVATKDDYSSGDESEESEQFDEPTFGFEGGDQDEDDAKEAEPNPVADAAVDSALALIEQKLAAQ